MNLSPMRISIILLTVATAVIHFVLAYDWTFYANSLGYLVLLAALYAPIAALRPYRGVIRWLLILFAAVTVVAFFVLGLPILTGPILIVGWITKAIEVTLIVLLVIEGRTPREA